MDYVRVLRGSERGRQHEAGAAKLKVRIYFAEPDVMTGRRRTAVFRYMLVAGRRGQTYQRRHTLTELHDPIMIHRCAL